MKRDQIVFLVGGFLFGILFGFGLFHALERRPFAGEGVAAQVSGPLGPPAPTQMGGGGGGAPPPNDAAPVMAEVARLKARLEEAPDDLVAILQLGDLYRQAGMWDQATGYYERAVALRPDDPDLITDLGICYRNSGSPERALEQFERAQGADTGHWESLFNTAWVAAFDMRDFDRAIAALEALEALDPRPADLDEAQVAALRQAIERAHATAPPQAS